MNEVRIDAELCKDEPCGRADVRPVRVEPRQRLAIAEGFHEAGGKPAERCGRQSPSRRSVLKLCGPKARQHRHSFLLALEPLKRGRHLCCSFPPRPIAIIAIKVECV